MVGRLRPLPTRTCVACRTARPKRALVRVVRTPEGSVVVDPTGKRSGRGAYLCPSLDCLRLAERRGSLARALATPVPPAVIEALAAQLTGGVPGGVTASGSDDEGPRGPDPSEAGADDRESESMNGGQRGTK